MVNLKGKKVLVFGLGASGLAAYDLLKKQKAKVYTFDDIKYPNKPIGCNIKDLDFAVISPGVPKTSFLYKQLVNFNIPVISEIELANLFVAGNIIAITGTNGKTTTVKLLEHIFKNSVLKRERKNVFACGNIGLPYSEIAQKTNKKSEIILELSSFQLENIKTFKPKISAILNLAPDHLDRYSNFNEYIFAKANIFKNQTEEDITIFNYLDENSKQFINLTKANVWFFSSNNESKNSNFCGVFLSDNKIYFKEFNSGSLFLVDVSKIKLIGKKNLENILICTLIAKIKGFEMRKVQKSLENFLPLDNRLEFVKKIKNITFINDSKATNIASALADISAVSGDKILLLGGSDKGEDFAFLANGLSADIKYIIVYGETGDKISHALQEKGFKNFCRVFSFEEACKKSYEAAKEFNNGGEITVMLVPACASYDEFENYVYRGKKFKKTVNSFK